MLNLLLNHPLAQVQPTNPIYFIIFISILLLANVIRIVRRRKAKGSRGSPFIYPVHPVIEQAAGASAAPTEWLIDAIRAATGAVPRAFPPSLTNYLTVLPPKWLLANQGDEQWINIKRQEILRRSGPVVWATTVQANDNLFKRNNAECGASVIYSPDRWFDQNREILGYIAHQCFTLKGTDPADPECATFARMLTNEMTRAMGLKVPRVFTGGREVYHSSMLMPRKHMPKGYITGSYFPVWIDPEKTGAIIMVPAAFWPASLTLEWDTQGKR